MTMKTNDFKKYNFNDMLYVVENEMEIHIEAIQAARKGIGQLWEDIEHLSSYVCCLESLLDMYEIDYEKQDF